MGAVALFGSARLPLHPPQRRRSRRRPGRLQHQHPLRHPSPPPRPGLLPLAPRRLHGWREWTLLGFLLASLCSRPLRRSPARPGAHLRPCPCLSSLVGSVPRGSAVAPRSRGRSRRGVVSEDSPPSPCSSCDRLPAPAPLPARSFRGGFEIPGLQMEAAYRWARDRQDTRIGIAGTTAGFLQYGLYGTDLSNRVVYLGEKGPHGAYNAIPTCAAFRSRRQRRQPRIPGHLPLPQLHPHQRPNQLPRGSLAPRGPGSKAPIIRSGPVTVWKLTGKLDPSACGQPTRQRPAAPESRPAGRNILDSPQAVSSPDHRQLSRRPGWRSPSVDRRAAG